VTTLRTRIRNQITTMSSSTNARYRNCSDPNWSSDGSVTTYDGRYLVTNDYVVKQFNKRRAKGEVFFNPYNSDSHFAYASGTGYIARSVAQSCTSPSLYTEYERNSVASFLAILPRRTYGAKYLPDFYTVVDSASVKKLRTEVASSMLNSRGRSDSNLFETLAEMDQTLGLMKKPITKLNSLLYKASRVRNPVGAARLAADKTAAGWLTYRYGIRPIISDIQAIVEGARKKVGVRRQTYRAKGKISSSMSDTITGTFDVATCTIKRASTHTVEVRATSLDEAYFSFLENIGFTSKGLLTLPWELVTLSFVADWFVNLGDFIGSLVPTPGLKNLGSCITERHDIQTVYTSQSTAVRSGYESIRVIQKAFDAECTVLRTYKVRDFLPVPGVVIKSDFKFDKVTRMADAVSLIVTRLNRLKL